MRPCYIVTMDFVTGLPKTKQGFDMIMTVVDKLRQESTLYTWPDDSRRTRCSDMFTAEIFRLHGLPATIISDRDSKFTSKFWQHLMQRLGTRIAMSTANHPQTDGQTERMNRTLEDMLRCLVNFHQDDWDHLLPLVDRKPLGTA